VASIGCGVREFNNTGFIVGDYLQRPFLCHASASKTFRQLFMLASKLPSCSPRFRAARAICARNSGSNAIRLA
jgi:hypothetical protein